MLKIFKLENLSFSQKWIAVLGSTVVAAGFCYFAAQRGEITLSFLLLFYVPLALSAALLGANITAALAVAIVVISLLSLVSVSAPVWILAVFFLGLAVNYIGWYRWI